MYYDVLFRLMGTPRTARTVSFRIAAEKLAELDAIAKSMDRDRSYLLNEAVENFISEQKRFAAMVEEGLEASRNGELIDHEEVAAMVETWEGERAETEVGARARA
jgi:RHH-type rel operon transcriptional repressor/antitoxin RelB